MTTLLPGKGKTSGKKIILYKCFGLIEWFCGTLPSILHHNFVIFYYFRVIRVQISRGCQGRARRHLISQLLIPIYTTPVFGNFRWRGPGLANLLTAVRVNRKPITRPYYLFTPTLIAIELSLGKNEKNLGKSEYVGGNSTSPSGGTSGSFKRTDSAKIRTSFGPLSAGLTKTE